MAKPLYSGPNTITLPAAANGLANGAAVQSAAVNNTSDLALEDLLRVTVKTAAGTLAANAVVNVYVAGSLDGTTWPDGLTGSAGTFTLPAAPNSTFLGTVNVNTAAAATVSRKFPVSLAFGGTLPPYWVVILSNATGLALDSSAGAVAVYEVVQTQ
ncbi:MAG: hypothetical protein JO250_09130 [Armatimonadetes bacterium]|nr:hypothetical protein [Armatimonadota bacterium]